MTRPDFAAEWRTLGALVLGRHDPVKSGLTLSALLPPSALPKAAQSLLAAGYFLEDLSAAQFKEGFLVTYHFDSDRAPGRLALRALADAGGELPSIASIFQGAEWHEREASDFFGIVFRGNPNPTPLLLSADHDGPPPLLKDSPAPMAAFGLFGEAEIIDPAAAPFVAVPEKKAAAPEKEAAEKASEAGS